MKKIDIDEEFSGAGWIWMFYTDPDSKTVKLKKIREAGKSKSKEFIPPTLEEVKGFFKERGYKEEAAIKFHDYYDLGKWKDKKGEQVKNWKQKASSVWFRDEHKVKEQSKTENKEGKFLF